MTVLVQTIPANQVTLEPSYVRVTAVAEQGPRGPRGQDGAGANTSVVAGDGLSGGGTLTSNITLAVDSTVARTTGVLTVDESNARIGIDQTSPLTRLQVGPVGMDFYTLTTTTNVPNQIADSWSASAFRSAKYQIQTYSISDSSYEISEIFIVHDDSEVYVTEYAQVRTNNPLCTYTAAINNGTVRLLCSPTYARNEIKVFRVSLSA